MGLGVSLPDWYALARVKAARKGKAFSTSEATPGALCPAVKNWKSHPEWLWYLYPRKFWQIRWRMSWTDWSNFEVSPALSRRLVWMGSGVPSKWTSAITHKDKWQRYKYYYSIINSFTYSSLQWAICLTVSKEGIYFRTKNVSFHIECDDIKY